MMPFAKPVIYHRLMFVGLICQIVLLNSVPTGTTPDLPAGTPAILNKGVMYG